MQNCGGSISAVDPGQEMEFMNSSNTDMIM
jgi:hypothetical protein